MSFFKKKKPQPELVEEVPAKKEELRQCIAFSSSKPSYDDIVFTSNVNIYTKATFRPKGHDDRNFTIELYLVADLHKKYRTNTILGEWIEVATVTKAIDGFYDTEPHLPEVVAPERDIEIRNIGEHLAYQYIYLLIHELEKENDLYLIGKARYNRIYTSSNACPPPKSYVDADYSFYDPELPSDPNAYLVIYKDNSSRQGDTRNTHVWQGSFSDKTVEYLTDKDITFK